MGVHRYYLAEAQGNAHAEAPPELVELGLMERFHWTPMQIDQIPLGKLQRLFITLEQRDRSQSDVTALQNEKKNKTKKGTKR